MHSGPFFVLTALVTFMALTSSSPSAESKLGHVQARGNMHRLMMEHDFSPQIALKEVQKERHLYALGVMAGLRGEVQIFDGKPWNSHLRDSAVYIDSSFAGDAALLVWSTVAHWSSFATQDSCANLEDLGRIVEKYARQAGLDPDSGAFPFIVRGKVDVVKCHVIDPGPGEGAFKTHDEMMALGWHGKMENVEVEILGFFSKHAAGEWTHMGADIHAHVRILDSAVAGHIDEVAFSGGMTLLLPESEMR